MLPCRELYGSLPCFTAVYKTVQNRTLPCSTAQYLTSMRYCTELCSSVKYGPVLCSTVQLVHRTAHYTVVLYSAAQYLTALCGTAHNCSELFSTVKYGGVQCSTVQTSPLLLGTVQYFIDLKDFRRQEQTKIMWYIRSVVQVFPLILGRVFLPPSFIRRFAFGCLFIFEVFFKDFLDQPNFFTFFSWFCAFDRFSGFKGF